MNPSHDDESYDAPADPRLDRHLREHFPDYDPEEFVMLVQPRRPGSLAANPVTRDKVTADIQEVSDAAGGGGPLYVRYDSEIYFGDTLCFTCGRSAVPGDMGEPGCPECAEREAEFARYTGRRAEG